MPAFGRPAQHQANLSAVVRLARATGADPVPAYVERLPNARFHTTFGPPVELITSIVVPRLDQRWMLPYLRFE